MPLRTVELRCLSVCLGSRCRGMGQTEEEQEEDQEEEEEEEEGD